MKTKQKSIFAASSLLLGASLLTTSCSNKADETEVEEPEAAAIVESAVAEEVSSSLRSPFESLPANTIVAVRFDNSAEMREQYVENTELGKLLFSDEKIERYKAFMDTLVETDEQTATFVEDLAEVGLELEDLYGMLSSNFGAAVVNQEVEGFNPMPTFLVWAEMEQEVVDTVYSAIIDAAADKENIERIDQEMAGVIGSRIRNTDNGSSFLTAKLENRFLYAIGRPLDEITMEDVELFEEAEWNALGVFVQAQQDNGGEFLSNFYADPGVSSARPEFETRFELLGDLSKAISYAPMELDQMIGMLDLQQFSSIALWSGLVGMEERSSLFIGAPSPRTGIATLIDGKLFDLHPSDWVPASAAGYSAFSFDMAQVYGLVQDTMRKAMPPEMVEQQIAQINAQLQGALQTDLDTLIASFGGTIELVDYEMETVELETPNGPLSIPTAPRAVVMDFSRPDILETAMAMASVMLSGPGSNIQVIDEQGFSGVRMQYPGGAQTLAFGQGKLVLATSESAATKIFSVLNNPPEGDDALVNDSEFREFISRHNPSQGIAFSYAQGNSVLKNLGPVFDSFSTAMKIGASNEDDASTVEEFLSLLPTEEELEGLLGAVFTRAHYNEWGLVVEGVNEYK